jgi:hypothetical protein
MRPLILVCFLFAACEHRPPAATPFQPAGTGVAPVVLHEVDLPQTEELDAILDGLNAIGAQRQVWTLLFDFLEHVQSAELGQSEGARRLVANAVVRVSHAPDFMEHFGGVRKAVDALLAVAPDGAETRFCRAYLRWILLADGQGGLRLGELEPRVVVDLAGDLRFLTQRYPTWRGPGEFDPARLRAELARVEAFTAALLAKRPTETAP